VPIIALQKIMSTVLLTGILAKDSAVTLGISLAGPTGLVLQIQFLKLQSIISVHSKIFAQKDF